MGRAWIIAMCLAGHAAADARDAKRLFLRGQQLLEAGKLEEACAAFADSQRTEARAGTLLNLADCQVRRGLTATARATFLQAKALAAQHHDKRRAAEADRRLAALEPELTRLTIVVAPELVVARMTIHRNGLLVDQASWNEPVVVDPGDYTIEVDAPGYHAWSKRRMLGAREQAMVVIEPLVADPAARLDAARSPAPTPATRVEGRTFAVGAVLGMIVNYESGMFGVRAVKAFDAPGGQVRAVGNTHVSRYHDDPDIDESFLTTTYTLGASLEYLWMPRPQLALGGGLGFGAEYDAVDPKLPSTDPRGERENDLGYFLALRASPLVLRLRNDTVEAGLHVTAVIAGDELTVNCIAAIDWFVW